MLPVNIKINKLQHIGIPVTDLKSSVAFYRRLGFVQVMSAAFEHNGGKGKCTMVRLKDIIIELYQMPEAELAEIRSRKNGHVDHVAFDVDDIEQTYAVLKTRDSICGRRSPSFCRFGKKDAGILTYWVRMGSGWSLTRCCRDEESSSQEIFLPLNSKPCYK